MQRKPRILVIGDFFTDRTVFYRTERESPEGGHPVVTQTHEINGAGGAGAVALMCEALGAEVVTAGHGRPRCLKVRHVVDGKVTFRCDDEATKWAIDADRECALIETREFLSAIIVADYGKGVVTPASFASAVYLSQWQRVPLLVDPCRDRMSDFYRGCTALFPNRNEAGVPSIDVAIGWAEGVSRRIEAECVCVKLDRDGYVAHCNGRSIFGRSECRPAEVVDVSGAGDQFIAATAVARANGASWRRAVAWGNELAGRKCRQWGATPVSTSFPAGTSQRRVNRLPAHV